MSKEKEACSDTKEHAKLDVRFRKFREDLDEILREIRDKGLIVSGDIGSGKTVLAQAFIIELKRFQKDVKEQIEDFSKAFIPKFHVGIFDKVGMWLSNDPSFLKTTKSFLVKRQFAQTTWTNSRQNSTDQIIEQQSIF